MYRRRFPPPWTAAKRGGSYVVTDAAGSALAYVYFVEGGLEVEMTTRRMSEDEARRIAVNIARLPDLLMPIRLSQAASLSTGHAEAAAETRTGSW